MVDFFRTVNAGTEGQLSHLLNYLPSVGYSVQLISFQDSPFLRDEAPRLFPQLEIKTLNAQSDISKSIFSFFRLYHLLRKRRPDIVQTFFPTSNTFGILMARLAGVKTLISSRRDMGFNLTKKDIAFYKMANRVISCVIANSRSVRAQAMQLEGLLGSKTCVIHNGISFDHIRQPSNNSNNRVVGIVANLNRPVKRVDLFIQAASIIHQDFPDVKFRIIGDGHLRSELEDLTASLGLTSSLSFLGRLSEIQSHLSEMKIGVICSDSEGFSNAIMEYMAAGLPVVATHVGGNPELVQHGKTGLLVPANDVTALAEAVKELLLRPGTAVEMGHAGREFLIMEFSLDQMLHKTTQLYECLFHKP